MDQQPYITTYRVAGRAFGSHIWAASRQEAEEIATRRGLGEQVAGIQENAPAYPTLAELFLAGKYVEAAHGAVFLCSILMHSNPAAVREQLLDCGPLHELLHRASFNRFGVRVRKQRFVQALQALEQQTPGYLPSQPC